MDEIISALRRSKLRTLSVSQLLPNLKPILENEQGEKADFFGFEFKKNLNEPITMETKTDH